MEENKNIDTILKSREQRFYYQKQLIKEYQKTLIVLKLNIPGPEKDGELYRKIFNNGLKILETSLEEEKIHIVFEKICNKTAGSQAFIIVDTDAIIIKNICVNIEETDGLGRIYDFDVMDSLGNQISREAIGKEQRRCFLCNEYVWVCSRSRAHSVDEMLSFIEKTAKTYFIKKIGGIYMLKRNKIIAMGLAVTMVGAGLFTGCGSNGAKTANTDAPKEYPKKAMEFIAPGGGGGVNLAYMQTKKASDTLLSVYSPPILLINLNGSSELGYKDTTPIARLITDYGAFVVGKDSKYNTINDVMEALKKDPKSVKIAGNSSAGSMDHIQFLMVAKAAGVEDIKEIDYISFQDGTATAQLLGGHVDLLSTGLGDVEQLLESGDLKALGQTAAERVGEGTLAEIPTVKEQGIDVTFENWRGLFGAPGMPEYAVKYWRETLAKMVETPEWDEACKKNGWDKAYLDSEEFTEFLGTANEGYKSILDEIGMSK